MRYLSVCSGIEAATCAWHPLGWQPFAFSEIEAFPSAVLAHHYPEVPNLGDMTKFKEWPNATVDLLVGGTPCQSFSIAGLRKGLDDPRGNLMLTYLAIADKYRPRWLVWENVPGVLSSNGGRDFGALLGGLVQLGYGFAYRVLDAQHFGVPQRRRRVFVVGHLGDWRRAAAVLFERHSLQGNTPPSREAGQGVAARARVSTFDCGGIGQYSSSSSSSPLLRTGADLGHGCEALIAQEIANQLTARMHKGINTTCDEGQTMITHSLRGEGFDASEDGTGRGTPLVPVAFAQNSRDEVRMLGGDGQIVGALAAEPGMKQTTYIAFHGAQDPDVSGDVTHPLGRNQGQDVCIAFQSATEFLPQSSRVYSECESSPTLQATGKRNGNRAPQIQKSMQVRRLTPRECERLQGFPDYYTLITVRGKPAADGPRYKALGNSMAVPVMRWIGERIQEVESIK